MKKFLALIMAVMMVFAVSAFALADTDESGLLEVAHDISDDDRIYTYAACQNTACHFFVFTQIIYNSKEMDSYCKLA